jgi:hypothetical protein
MLYTLSRSWPFIKYSTFSERPEAEDRTRHIGTDPEEHDQANGDTGGYDNSDVTDKTINIGFDPLFFLLLSGPVGRSHSARHHYRLHHIGVGETGLKQYKMARADTRGQPA